MKKRIRNLAKILAMTMILALLAACGGQQTSNEPAAGSGAESPAAPSDDGRVYTMRIGAIAALPTAQAVFIEELVDIIDEATNGRIKVEAYHSGTLGTVAQMIQGLQDGSVEGVSVPINFYVSSVPEIAVLGLPMIFRDADHLYDLTRTKGNGLHEMLAELLEDKGFVMGCWNIAFPMLILANRPVATLEDFNGLRVWCQPNAQVAAAFNALGAVPVNFDTGDLAIGLQQRTVDAAYTSAQLLGPMRLHETAKHMFIFNPAMHIGVNTVMLSKVFVDSLPGDLREILLDTLYRADEEVYYDLAVNSHGNSYNAMTGADGMTIVYSDDAMTENLKQLMEPIYEEFLNTTPTARPLYEKVLELIAAEG